MRIPSGKTDCYLYFIGVDPTDLKTRETGLTSFTVVRSRNGAADVTYTTPTVTEIDTTTMPGVYALLIDEDTTITSGADSEEVCVHITQASMAPVTRTFELYWPIITSGTTITVANGCADADIERLQGNAIATPTVSGVLEVDVTHWIGTAAATPTVAGVPEVDVTHLVGTAQSATDLKDFADDGYDPSTNKIAGVVLADTLTTYTGNTPQTGDTYALANGANGFVAIKGDTAAILTDTGTTLDGKIDAILEDTGTTLPATLATVAGYLDTEIAAILADTNELQTDWVDGGRLDLLIDAIKAKSDLIPGTQDGLTFAQSMMLQNAVLLGKASGLGTTTAVYRSTDDGEDRVTATVDADGNRTAVTLNTV